MVSKKSTLVAIVITVFVVVASCRKDAILFAPTPQTLQVPNSLPSNFPKPLPSNNPQTKEGIALGRKLFYDNILSVNNTQNCGSCHNQAFAFTDNGKALSRGIDGSIGDRNSMPLMNLLWNKTFFWDGRTATLEEQALQPIEDIREMKNSVDSVIKKLNEHPEYPALFYKAFGNGVVNRNNLGKAIAQFERTLISGNSRYDQILANPNDADTFTAQELRGYLLFTNDNPKTGGDCIHCHTIGSTFSDYDFKNNGLDAVITDEGRKKVTSLQSDLGKFKTPSLRNISLTAPYMHDGRFATLEQVLDHYNKDFHQADNTDPVMLVQSKNRLTKNNIKDIVAFLQTLTDSTFIHNKEFGKP